MVRFLNRGFFLEKTVEILKIRKSLLSYLKILKKDIPFLFKNLVQLKDNDLTFI